MAKITRFDAIYARQSVYKEDSVSIEAQIDDCKRLCSKHVRIYSDKGWSGKDVDRPDMQKLIKDIQSGIIQKVVVYKIDRISRNLSDFCNLFDMMKDAHCGFVSATQSFDTTDPMGEAMLKILFIFAEMERKNTQARIIDNYNYRIKEDCWASEPHPFSATGKYDFIWAVLDGQQRLTSLYIALQGSISRKLPWKHRANDDAFPKKELYFNLHSEKQNEDDDITYEFAFLTAEEAAAPKSTKMWYKVKDIIRYKSPTEVMTKVIKENGWITDPTAMENLLLLHERLVLNELINYFEVETKSIDDVLDIFVRVNSGGTVLSKSDLLFSTVVSHWDKARDEIDELLVSVNRIGDGYRFTNDFIMRACLYLLNLPTSLKVETFKRASVLCIKEE